MSFSAYKRSEKALFTVARGTREQPSYLGTFAEWKSGVWGHDGYPETTFGQTFDELMAFGARETQEESIAREGDHGRRLVVRRGSNGEQVVYWKSAEHARNYKVERRRSSSGVSEYSNTRYM